MSEEGDKTCPLCAEEMDLTDQQLKPCRCGYEICVWCWHHIMDMAEKDETDGCCPACRTPYDKERIVGTAPNCERLVSEINMEKKHKSQKAKSKTSENRKQLSSVRVIQKNLVYVVGLPLNLADEDILQRKEYFSQYGKVLKVSISRTSAGTIQQFPNNTCSVYITYGKEEEAVRCIQSVHGFILDGRPLRVCFGTTKYCHAWLRNMPCNNPDCLYLHEIGSQEDSFTKDEIISAYTRSKVQQITGYSNNTQRHTGNVLPPPVDDYCNNAPLAATPVVRSSSNNSTGCTKGSPPTSSSGRSGALPPAASWGACASNANNPAAGAFACSNGPTKQKSEIVKESQPLSTAVSNISQDKLLSSDGGKKRMTNEDNTHSRQSPKRKDMNDTSKHHHTGRNTQKISTEVSPTSSGVSAVKSATQSRNPSVTSNNGGDGHVLHNPTLSGDGRPCSPVADKSTSSIADEDNRNLCSDLSSMTIENRLEVEDSGAMRPPNGLCLGNFVSSAKQIVPEEFQGHSTLVADTSTVSAVDSAISSSNVCDWKPNAQALVKQNPTSETEEDDFDSQRFQDAIVVSQATMRSSSPLHFLSHLRGPTLQHVDNASYYGLDYASNPPLVNVIPDDGFSSVASGVSNGFLGNFVTHASGHGNPLSQLDVDQVNQVSRFKGVTPDVGAVHSTDLGESNIISNILELDSWDESLTSPQNLAKLLGETDKQEGSIKLGGPWKGQNSNQSRFSFARQEESINHLYNFQSPLSNIGHLANNHSVGQGFVENRDLYMGRLGNGFGHSQGNIEQSDMFSNGNSIFPYTGRSQMSAPRPPPGFGSPSRPPPPPGFNLHDRNDLTFEMNSGDHFPEPSALLRNTYQSSPVGNTSTNPNDIEFLDPAILAVGKGRLPSSVSNSSTDIRSNYHVQNPLFENESRLLLMQRSVSPHQNLRYNDVRDNFSPVNDAYGFNTARHLEQSQQVSNLSSFPQFSHQQARNTVMSNGHWDNWNEIPATNDSITNLLRNDDRLGYTKFGMTSSGDIYNQGFRM